MLTAAINNIVILCLPSHLTHLLQPNDAGLNKLFKTELYSIFGRAVSHNVPQTFVQLTDHVTKALEHDNIPKSIRNSFRHCGIWPFDRSRIEPLLAKESADPNYSSIPQVGLAVSLMEERQREGDRLREEAQNLEKNTPRSGNRKRGFFNSSHSVVLTDESQIAFMKLDNAWKEVKLMKAHELHAYLMRNADIYNDTMIYRDPVHKRFRRVKELEELVYQTLESRHQQLKEVFSKSIREKDVVTLRELI